MKPDKMLFIIYVDIQSLSRQTDVCGNNPEKLWTMKIGEHIPCEYSVSTIWGFDYVESKHTLYHGKDCMKKFCNSLKEQKYPFWKKRNVTINKRRIKIISRGKSMLYIHQRKSLLKMKIFENSEIIANNCTGKYRGAA